MPLVHCLDRVQAALALDRDDPPRAPLSDLGNDVERIAVVREHRLRVVGSGVGQTVGLP